MKTRRKYWPARSYNKNNTGTLNYDLPNMHTPDYPCVDYLYAFFNFHCMYNLRYINKCIVTYPMNQIFISFCPSHSVVYLVHFMAFFTFYDLTPEGYDKFGEDTCITVLSLKLPGTRTWWLNIENTIIHHWLQSTASSMHPTPTQPISLRFILMIYFFSVFKVVIFKEVSSANFV